MTLAATGRACSWILLLAPLWGCHPAGTPRAKNDVRVATVDGVEVSRSRFATLLEARLRGRPAAERAPEERALACELIDELLVEREARRRSISSDESDAARRSQALRERLADVTLTVTLDEARQFYADNRAAFHMPPRVRMRRIALMLPREAGAEAQRAMVERAASLRAEAVVSEARFAEFARRWSGAASAATGGIEESDERALPTEVWRHVAALRPGEVSAPLVVGDAVWLVRMETLLAAHERAFDEVRPAIETVIRTRRRSERIARLLDGLRRAARIENHVEQRVLADAQGRR